MLTPDPAFRPRALAALATAATAVLLLVPAPPPPLAEGLAALPLDKVVHAGLFFVLVRL
jgi:hypothetical protein